jgi:hypothetical protein
MNSSVSTSKNNKPEITITNSILNDDGSTTVEYICNNGVLNLCAEELEKDIKQLTKEEIHNFVMYNIGSALKCHNGWKKKKID